jgi:hypothetical protein
MKIKECKQNYKESKGKHFNFINSQKCAGGRRLMI